MSKNTNGEAHRPACTWYVTTWVQARFAGRFAAQSVRSCGKSPLCVPRRYLLEPLHV
jgi:hypothetical protein